ncbi:Mucin-associated surface protein (MASP) subgroup S030 [Trypanosoma cruzi]|uniref:Mucin-associated surface protein (MASP) subgroup S030 n=1 Tax=Trypanosoma cruzi TaxID=5693 RepID=A0A7J6Y6B2_TRYCR|nr:Mucin-associated surface protein (MASP) subgroup S030 [Trypanosoma cruzi]
MMTGRVLLVCSLCVLWCGAGGGYGWAVGHCAVAELDDAKLAKGMDGEVVLMKRDCVPTTALRGVLTAVPAAGDSDELGSPDAGVCTSGKQKVDAEESPVVFAGSEPTPSGSGAVPTASSPASADTIAASSTPVSGAGGAVGPNQQPAVVSGCQDDSSSGGREGKEREEAGSAGCGEEPPVSSMCSQPPLVAVDLTICTADQNNEQKDNASFHADQQMATQNEDEVPHVPGTRASVQTPPVPAPAGGQPGLATQPSEELAEHATAPNLGLSRDASNGDSQEQTPQPQTPTDTKQSLPVLQGLSEGVQENQNNMEDGKKRNQVDSSGNMRNKEHDSASEKLELLTASINTRPSGAPGNESDTKSLSGTLRSSTAGTEEQAKAGPMPLRQPKPPEEKVISEELPPTAAEVEAPGGPSAPPPKSLPQSALPSSKEVPDTTQSTEDPHTKGIEPTTDARQNAITEGQAETTSPSSSADDAAANDADESNAEIANDGSAVHAGVPEEEPHQEQVDGSEKQTSFTSTAKKYNAAIEDNDGSPAASHTTSPLLLLLVVVCAAAAAVVAA